MKVLVVPADSGGCGFYRMREPARVVSELGDFEVRVDDWIKLDAAKNEQTGEIRVDEIHEDVDLLVIQRPLKKYLTELIVQAQSQGIAVVVDIDDHFDALHPGNMAYRAILPDTNPLENSDWVRSAAEVADLVTVSTDSLAEYYGAHGRVEVLRNCVPESISDFTTVERKPLNVGWTGTMRTHPTDLQVTDGGVARAVRESKSKMFVLGDPYGVGQALSFPLLFQVDGLRWVPLDKYYETIAQNVNVGIVPLDMIEFNVAKSSLKGLEFAALGIPFVASPTPEYKLLAEAGVGELAANKSEWRRKLNAWLENPRKRLTDGARYRDMVLAEYTYEANAHRWRDAWLQAIENRKAASSEGS